MSQADVDDFIKYINIVGRTGMSVSKSGLDYSSELSFLPGEIYELSIRLTGDHGVIGVYHIPGTICAAPGDATIVNDPFYCASGNILEHAYSNNRFYDSTFGTTYQGQRRRFFRIASYE